MGFNSTVVIMNDCLSDIEGDKDFGKKLSLAIRSIVLERKPIDVSAGSSCNAATVIESHHADGYVTIATGGNCGHVLNEWTFSNPNSKEFELELLKSLAKRNGYRIVRLANRCVEL